MKAVMISIQPQWTEKILNGEKTVEVRKTAPKLQPPFKCYIYCTKNHSVHDLLEIHSSGKIHKANGKVVAEFVCDEIKRYCGGYLVVKEDAELALAGSCLTRNQVIDYLGGFNTDYDYNPNRFNFFGYHISELKVYDKPKELNDFQRYPMVKYDPPYIFPEPLKRPPQSWCYVEERR